MMDQDWVKLQTNAPLQGEHDVSRAYVEMIPYALPYHNERWKNWDLALALYHTYYTTNPDEAILDAGACRNPQYPSPYLPGLQKLGFQRLAGCNLDETRDEYENGIRYHHGDITKLSRYTDAYFGFVACLSVIEHGVDWHLFIKEMSRVIRRGGHLFVSFDYWEDRIDTGGRMAFGAPVHVYDRGEVTGMALFADLHGLEVVGDLNLHCRDRVVKWLGMEYTFCNMLFKRV